ncbi:MAPEG family protein [soil metagenome]
MLKPVLAMVGLTFIVWLRLYMVRIPEMRRRRIHPQSVATSVTKAGAYEDIRASDNFVNLFEMPVLFYVAAFTAIVTGLVTPVSLGLAWTFVALRVLHSLIQCSYNKVMHRFTVYSLSSVVLLLLWLYLALYQAW